MKHILFVLLAVVVMGGGCVSVQNTPNTPATNTSAPVERPTSGPTLDLSGRGLTAIPSDVFSRTDLETLNLSNNALTGAPQAEIRHLQNLKVLNLSANNLTGLPAELGQLRKLEILDASNNRLTGLPLELGNLTQLRVLDVTGNNYSTQDLDQIAARLPNTEIRR